MAKVTAPLLSLQASGTFKNELIFSKAKHFTYLKSKSTMRKSPYFASSSRLAQQLKFKLAKEAWLALDIETKQAYNALRYPTGQTGYNIFLSRYLSQGIDLSDFPYLLAIQF